MDSFSKYKLSKLMLFIISKIKLSTIPCQTALSGKQFSSNTLFISFSIKKKHKSYVFLDFNYTNHTTLLYDLHH
jgi:hypothetical protein